MQRVLAYELQCDFLGGHSARTKRALKAALRDDQNQHAWSAGTEGTVLVREWNGRTYRGELMPDGYSLDGMSYSSLTAVAHHITGAKWSGPRFFGLTPPRHG